MPRDCGGLRCVDSVASSPPSWVSRSRQGLSRKPAPSPAPSSPSSGARPPSPDSDVALAPPPWTWDPDVPSSASTPRPVPRGRYPYNRSSRRRARETAISGPTLALARLATDFGAPGPIWAIGDLARPNQSRSIALPAGSGPGRDRRRSRGAQKAHLKRHRGSLDRSRPRGRHDGRARQPAGPAVLYHRPRGRGSGGGAGSARGNCSTVTADRSK